MDRTKNKVLIQEGNTVSVVAENDRLAIKVVDEYLKRRDNGYFTTGEVKCTHYPAYDVEIYKP